jgi:hypothetical protein
MGVVRQLEIDSDSGPPHARQTSVPNPPSVGTATRDAPEERSGEVAPWPRQIGRFEVRGLLGTGGMGVVLEAHDPELGRAVAIKLLRGGSASRNARLRLLREAQAMARLSHPNVVQIYDVGTIDDDIFLAMELVRGTTVERWLAARDRGWREILAPFLDAGRGLAAAHAVGLVHRDFKPSNVLLAEDGRVVVADFGVAAYVHDTGDREAGTPVAGFLAAHLTATGAVVGTPLYMAPEQYGGERPTAAADQFSFCVALFEALYGKLPFEGPTLESFANNVLAGAVVVPAHAPSGAPPWILAALRRGLQVKPTARYPGIVELLAALQDDPDVRRRRRARRVAIGIGVAGLVGLAGWGLAQRMAAAPCTGGAAKVAQVWNEQRRAAIGAALGEAAASDARAITGALDDLADDLAKVQDEQCTAHRTGELSSALFDASQRCLELRRAGVDDFVGLVTAADAPPAADARAALARLPLASTCRDRDALSSDAVPAEVAHEVDALRRRIGAAQMQHDAGRIELATTELARLAADADALGYEPVAAEVALAIGRKAIDRMAYEDADVALAEATRRALASRADAVAAESATRRGFTRVMLATRVEDAKAELDVARGLVERVGSPAWLAALLANNTGVAHGMAGEGELAAQAFARATTLASESDAVHVVDRVGYVTNAAMHDRDPVTRDESFARAIAMLSEALGPGHPSTIDLAARRAKYLVDPTRAIELLGPLCAELRRDAAAGAAIAWCPLALVELHDAQGDTTATLAAIADATASVERERDASPQWAEAKLLVLAGHRALLQGDARAALDPLGEAHARMEPHTAAQWIALELAEVEVLQARAKLVLGDRDAARTHLRSAIAVLKARTHQVPDQPPVRTLARAQAMLASL